MNTSRVTHKEQCPKCAKQGNDQSRDNLICYEDGGKYCFACGYTGALSEEYKKQKGIIPREIVIKNERTFRRNRMGKYKRHC